MRAEKFLCAHCRSEKPGPAVIMPRPWLPLTGCSDCKAIALASPKAQDFTVERNFKSAGTSSQAAQAAAKTARMNDTHRLVWKAIRETPMTADEVAKVTGLDLLTARPRMSDLVKAGWAEATGERRAPYPGASDRNVYRAVSKAEQGEAA